MINYRLPKEGRPNCPNPDCNGSGLDMIGNGGARWVCRLCGTGMQRFPKNRVGPHKKTFYDRPPCPLCGEYRSLKAGSSRYRCGECGITYEKNYLIKMEL